MNLRDLPRHTAATVAGFAANDTELETRLREIGFAEGDNIESLHRGLFGGNPIAVKLNGTFIALRKEEAAAILVERRAAADIVPLSVAAAE